MATKLDVTQTFSGDIASVWALQVDPAYLVFRAERAGATSASADIAPAADGGVVITVTRVLPADVPSFAKSMVGETITITEHYTWAPPAADGSRTGTMTAESSAPIAVTARLALTPQGGETVLTTTGEIKSSIPFVGGKVEDLAKQQTERYLHKEQKLAAAWLAGER